MPAKKQYAFCNPPLSHTLVYMEQGQQKQHDLAMDILTEKFGVDAQQLKQEGIRFLFAANNHSYSGELADTFVFFVDKHGQAFEVWGTECSVWDFNGQWEPEEVVVRHWMNSLDDEHGMGRHHDDGSNLWRMEFIQALDALFPYFDDFSQQAMRDAPDNTKQHMPQVLAACLHQEIEKEIEVDAKPRAKLKLL